MANKNTLFVTVPLDLKHREASFSPNSTDLLYLRCRDMAIFLLTDNNHNDNDRTDHSTPCACACGNNIRLKSCILTKEQNNKPVYVIRYSRYTPAGKL